ncbi:MAG: Hsp20/alpha crystallin family protein, partial [Vicinamibacterales bacterium]
MAEERTGIRRARDERGMGRSAPAGLGGGSLTALQRFADDVDRMFEEMGFPRAWALPAILSSSADASRERPAWMPPIDVIQKEDQLVIKADLPGMTRDDLSIEVSGDTLTIQGERKSDREEQRNGVYRQERTYGRFCRTILLPEGAITDQCQATFSDGVLEITLPVPPESTRHRRIEIGDARPAGETRRARPADTSQPR